MSDCFLNQDFFDKNKCTSFVFIKDKEKLLNYINNFKLPYQNKININSKFQYGYEIEFANANLLDVNDDVKNNYDGKTLIYCNDWYVTSDDSIAESTSLNPRGGELIAPISYNTKDEWEELVEICDILKYNSALIDQRCSLHVHIDFDKLELNPCQLEKFLKLWAIYENVIYKFSMGEHSDFRKGIVDFARPFINQIVYLRDHAKINDLIITESQMVLREQAINFQNLDDRFNERKVKIPTIEFRIANGTLDPKIIQNLIRFYCNLLNSVLKEDDLINYYTQKKFNALNKINHGLDNIEEYNVYKEAYDILEEYKVSDLDSALELVDIIFNNNIDKLCFLKQYLKNNDIEHEKKIYKKSI